MKNRKYIQSVVEVKHCHLSTFSDAWGKIYIARLLAQNQYYFLQVQVFFFSFSSL